MLKMPVISGLGNVVPMSRRQPARNDEDSPAIRLVPAGQDTVRFGAAAAPKASILDDPFMVNFNVPVTPETAAQLNNALMKIAGEKKQLGGTVKLLINTPGGEVYSGLQTVQLIKRLGVPVDGIIMGGQAASMGSLLFLAATGRRVMTPDSSLMIHQPRVSGASGTLTDLKQVVDDMDGLFRRMQRLIQEKTGLSAEKVEEITGANNDFRILPLKALQMGFATHVLLENGKAVTQAAIQNLDDAEIARRDRDNDYDGLKSEAFDAKIMDPAVEAHLRQQQAARRGGGNMGPSTGLSGGFDMEDSLGGRTIAGEKAEIQAFRFNQPSQNEKGHATGPRIYLQA